MSDSSQYSNRYSKLTSNNSKQYSTVTSNEVLANIQDLIANPDYEPWFAKQIRTLGIPHFMELANKARAGSDSPAILFKWMLNNPEKVK